MLTEQKVRAKIKACKILIKNCKENLTIDKMHDQMQNIFVVEILKHQKLRLKYLRRELPALLVQIGTNRVICPICGQSFFDTDRYNYCPNCGQRVRPMFEPKGEKGEVIKPNGL